MTKAEPDSLARPSLFVLLLVVGLAILVYLPLYAQPLLEDDYSNILLARAYGPFSGWPAMFHDPIFRLRTTSWLMLYGVNRWFGMQAAAYYTVMILLHAINTALVYSLGVWSLIGFELSAWAAGFFAIYEGHQEAVMWVSAANEPFQLLFGLLAFICWIRFLDRRAPLWYAGALVSFCLALLSKESAVILVPLLALPIALNRIAWRSLGWLLPFAIAASLAGLSILESRANSFRFHDGSFSLHAPFWLIWPDNLARMLWFLGLVSLVAISAWRPPGFQRILAIGFCWAAIGLVPYSFLTYSTRIPSRQMYFASVGLAIVVGYALLNLYRRYWPRQRMIVVVVCAAMLAYSIGYLWTKKRAQFLARAAPTEQLIALARTTQGPIYIQCFPRPPLVAESALQLMTRRPASDLIWNAVEARARHAAATFCYADR